MIKQWNRAAADDDDDYYFAYSLEEKRLNHDSGAG